MVKLVINRIDDFLAVCEKAIVVLLFSVLVILIVFNIVSRNLFQVSFQKILEVAPAFVLWLALLGSSLALKSRRHIRLELLLRYCTSPLRYAAGILTGLFGMTVMGILFYASLGFVENEVAIFGPWGWMSLIFPLFFAISCFRYLTLVINGPPGESAGDVGLRTPGTDKAAIQ